LPDVTYKLVRLKLFGEYALDKTSYLRLDLIYQRTYFNEWTYNFNGVPFTYSDNTTLNSVQNQRVTFLGVSYVYRFK
jgi:Putative outer membrane beta-barrel porin, MtrB/PioB